MLALYGALGSDDRNWTSAGHGGGTIATFNSYMGPVHAGVTRPSSGGTGVSLGPATGQTRPPTGSIVTAPPPPMPPFPPASAPLPPDVIITTSSPPSSVPIGPDATVPGAGPHITVTPGQNGVWYDLFDPASFRWWKPVLLAGGIALFGGAILALFKRKR